MMSERKADGFALEGIKIHRQRALGSRGLIPFACRKTASTTEGSNPYKSAIREAEQPAFLRRSKSANVGFFRLSVITGHHFNSRCIGRLAPVTLGIELADAVIRVACIKILRVLLDVSFLRHKIV